MSVYDGTVEVDFGRTGAEGAPSPEGRGERRRVSVGQALVLAPGQAPVWEKIDLREDWSDGWQRREAVAQGQIRVGVKRALIRDLRDLNPEVYLSVEVELKGRQGTFERFHAAEARIRKIKIRSLVWDRLQAGEKVDLLNETFAVLKQRYPSLTHSVILEFDDGRSDLELKYAMSLKG